MQNNINGTDKEITFQKKFNVWFEDATMGEIDHPENLVWILFTETLHHHLPL